MPICPTGESAHCQFQSFAPVASVGLMNENQLKGCRKNQGGAELARLRGFVHRQNFGSIRGPLNVAALSIAMLILGGVRGWASTKVVIDGSLNTSGFSPSPYVNPNLTVGPFLSLSGAPAFAQQNTDDTVNVGNYITSISKITLQNAGDLEINTNNAITQTAGIVFGTGTASTWNLNNFSQTVNYLNGTTGTVDIGDGTTGTGTLTIQQTGANQAQTFGGSITDNGNLVINATGTGTTMTLSGTNSYSGTLTVTNGTLIVTGTDSHMGATTVNGTLQLGVGGVLSQTSGVTVNSGGTLQFDGNGASQVHSTATVTLAGGKIDLSGLSGSLTQTLGKLTLSSSSVIDFGSLGTSTTLRFANSSSAAWTGTLSIWDWNPTVDTIFFGNSNLGLTTAQLADINFYGDQGMTLLQNTTGAQIYPNGGLAEIPEPSAIAVGIGLLGLIVWRERKRFRRSPGAGPSEESAATA